MLVGDDARAAPDVVDGIRLEGVGRDDAEVVDAALESIEEIRVVLGVGIDQGSISEDNLEVDDVVTSHAILVREVGKTG